MEEGKREEEEGKGRGDGREEDGRRRKTRGKLAPSWKWSTLIRICFD